MQGSNIACVFMLCLDFGRLWKFTNGRTQHILILFRNSNVLLSQERVIYSQSHWVAVFPEHQCFVHWCDAPCEPALPLLLACVDPWGIFPTQGHALVSTTTFSLQGSHCLGSPWIQRLIGQQKAGQRKRGRWCLLLTPQSSNAYVIFPIQRVSRLFRNINIFKPK